MSDQQIFILVAILVLGASLWFDHRRAQKAQTMLRDWLAQHDFQLVSSVRRWVPPLSLFFRISRHQVVFRVEARDRQGRRQVGFAVCGGFWLGMFTERVNMRWDDAA